MLHRSYPYMQVIIPLGFLIKQTIMHNTILHKIIDNLENPTQVGENTAFFQTK